MNYAREFKTSDGATLRYETLGSGPTVVALHGFPDTLRTWDAVATGLVDAGFHVVTLAMRGYAPSDVPPFSDYSIARLAQDVSDLLDHLQVRRVIVIGHDWGASAGYALAARFPERVSTLLALAIPPLSLEPRGMKERWARPHNLYLGLGSLSAWWLRRKEFREVERLYRRWSPSWQVPQSHLETVLKALDPEDRSRAAVDYYKLGMTDQADQDLAVHISTRTLVIYGSDEPAIRKAGFKKAKVALGEGSRVVMIDGVGHWPHLEAPQICLEEILDFLVSKA